MLLISNSSWSQAAIILTSFFKIIYYFLRGTLHISTYSDHFRILINVAINLLIKTFIEFNYKIDEYNVFIKFKSHR